MGGLLKKNNIIIGLLKNMLRKNIYYAQEGFKVFDEHSFKVKLNISGFDQELIKEAFEELSSNKKWHNSNNEQYYMADISSVSLNDETAIFLMQKSKLIELRDSILKSK